MWSLRHSPDRPVSLDLPEGLPDGYEPPSTFKKFDAVSKQAMVRGHRDESGTAVTLDDDDFSVPRHGEHDANTSSCIQIGTVYGVAGRAIFH